ncbi:hypothetical protein NDU88_006821 [Pleurodeles waltl]|uniref:Uncharacterized protein n=1 Tax=Pleurodeles waltl TaxID=8319 RepID=A0AAV7NRH8_PLEWA|nr:hypothetical protein NDU88_006821 [Pleurodeles waltl]
MEYSRLSSNAALETSDWRCSRATEDIVPRCHGDQEAGACTMNPDFRVPGKSNTEGGLESGAAEEQDAEEPAETESGEPKDNDRRSGDPGVPREAADPEEQERNEDTLRGCQVPGGAWLTKVRSFLKDNIRLKRENGGRRGEGRDSAERVGEGSSWEGAGR